jgi:hypothetical protein
MALASKIHNAHRTPYNLSVNIEFVAFVAFSTAGNAIHPYLGYMQPLWKEDVFTGVSTHALDRELWSPPSRNQFDTFRGLLTAGAVGLPTWAIVILFCYWIWL